MNSLYALTSDLAQIEKILESEESSELFEKQNELSTMIVEKVDSIVGYNQSQDDYLEAISNRIKELQELKKNVEKKQERFNKYVLTCMSQLNINSITGKISSIKIKEGSTSVEIYDESLLDAELFRAKTVIEPMKDEIKKLIKNGENVNGARLKKGDSKVVFKVGKWKI